MAFEAGLEISAHILAVVPAAAVGLLCGGLGVGFTLLNLKVTRLRDATLGRTKWRRCVEPCVLAALYVTGTMLLPRLFPCTPTHCVAYQGQVYCGMPGGAGGVNGTIGVPDTPPLALPLYTCAVGSGAAAAAASDSSWSPGSGTLTPDSPGDSPGGNSSTTVYYNELATLMLNTGRGLARSWGFGHHAGAERYAWTWL